MVGCLDCLSEGGWSAAEAGQWNCFIPIARIAVFIPNLGAEEKCQTNCAMTEHVTFTISG